MCGHLSSAAGVVTRSRVVDLLAALAALVGPGEVRDGDDEEAGVISVHGKGVENVKERTCLSCRQYRRERCTKR